ncbi:MAG: hypothetical protein NXH75_11315 [Halobacteriovoraceae bacterium]|nr:hypothetical protein [Halobacteriovoraceae bacterium]
MKKLTLILILSLLSELALSKDPFIGLCTFGNVESTWFYRKDVKKDTRHPLDIIKFYEEPSTSSKAKKVVDRKVVNTMDFFKLFDEEFGEVSYENYGAILYEKSGDFLRFGKKIWIKKEYANCESIGEFLESGLTFFPGESIISFSEEKPVNGKPLILEKQKLKLSTPADVIDHTILNGEVWIKVKEKLTFCGDPASFPEGLKSEFWMKAFLERGKEHEYNVDERRRHKYFTIMFSSRGC